MGFSTDVTAVVLAGGKSTRMGTDKSLLPIAGKTMIEHILSQLRPRFDKILISSNNPALKTLVPEEVIADQVPDRGPVMGLITAMDRATTPAIFVQACDIPVTIPEILTEILGPSDGFDAVVPKDAKERLEPLFALYKRSALPAMNHVLQHEKGQANRIGHHCKTKFVELPQGVELKNINTISEYRAFQSRTV